MEKDFQLASRSSRSSDDSEGRSGSCLLRWKDHLQGLQNPTDISSMEQESEDLGEALSTSPEEVSEVVEKQVDGSHSFSNSQAMHLKVPNPPHREGSHVPGRSLWVPGSVTH